MNPIVVNTVAIREDPSQYLIRYGIEMDRFAQVLSSVTSRSVLLLGVARDKTRNPAGTEPRYSLIAVIPLTASVDPDQTAATLEGNDLVLRLAKSGDPVRGGCLTVPSAAPDAVRTALIEVHHGRDGKATRETVNETDSKKSPRTVELHLDDRLPSFREQHLKG